MKKEITIAASSAVALIVLLGSASYLLFPKVSVQASTASIDLYTQNNGKGINQPSGNFTWNTTVTLYAEVKNASSAPQQGRFVSFEVHWPANDTGSIGNLYFLDTAQTNGTGIASLPFRIPLTQTSIGKWLVYSTVVVDGEFLADTVTFFVSNKGFSPPSFLSNHSHHPFISSS